MQPNQPGRPDRAGHSRVHAELLHVCLLKLDIYLTLEAGGRPERPAPAVRPCASQRGAGPMFSQSSRVVTVRGRVGRPLADGPVAGRCLELAGGGIEVSSPNMRRRSP